MKKSFRARLYAMKRQLANIENVEPFDFTDADEAYLQLKALEDDSSLEAIEGTIKDRVKFERIDPRDRGDFAGCYRANYSSFEGAY